MDITLSIEQQAEEWVRAIKKAETKIKAEEEMKFKKKAEEDETEMSLKRLKRLKREKPKKTPRTPEKTPRTPTPQKCRPLSLNSQKKYRCDCVYFTDNIRVYRSGVIERRQKPMMGPENWSVLSNWKTIQHFTSNYRLYVVKDLYKFCFENGPEPQYRRSKPYC